MDRIIKIVEPSDESKKILCEIDGYINNIKCQKLMGKGSIDDYKTLFRKVFEYSDELAGQKIGLDMDMKKLSNFADSAEQLTENISKLTERLKLIISVNDIKFLNDFKDKVRKISKLYETIEEFQKTIIGSSELYIPTTLEKVNNKLCKITKEIDKSMIYLDNFTGIFEDKIIPENGSISNTIKESVQKTCDSLDTRKKYINTPPPNIPSSNKYIIYMSVIIFIIIILIAYIYKYKYMIEMLVLIIIASLILMVLLLL